MATEVLQKKSGLVTSFAMQFLEFPITGLDISDLSMKYVSFHRARRNKISIGTYGEIHYPEGIVTHGEINDEQKLTEIFVQWYAKEKKQLASPFVAISLPEEKSFIRTIQIPQIRKEDVPNAIRWEIENQIPLPLEEVHYDYEVLDPLAPDQDHLDVNIIAFPRNILDAYVRVIKGAGLQPFAIELESQSLVRACIQTLNDPEAKIILDIGRTRTSLVIFVTGAILYTSTIEVGGLTFEQHIAKQLAISLKQAEQIKITVGLDRAPHQGEVFAALVPAISAIGDELTRAIVYYRAHSSHAHGATPDIQRILISGGDANLSGIDTYLSSVLKIRVERADPFSIMRNELADGLLPLTRSATLAFTAAIGLALREIRRD